VKTGWAGSIDVATIYVVPQMTEAKAAQSFGFIDKTF
jgi:hypothetical protein